MGSVRGCVGPQKPQDAFRFPSFETKKGGTEVKGKKKRKGGGESPTKNKIGIVQKILGGFGVGDWPMPARKKRNEKDQFEDRNERKGGGVTLTDRSEGTKAGDYREWVPRSFGYHSFFRKTRKNP